MTDKTLSAGEDMEQLEVSYSAGKSVNWYRHFGKLVVSIKAEHTYILWLRISPLRNLSYGNVTDVHTLISARMLLVILSVIDLTGNNLKAQIQKKA